MTAAPDRAARWRRLAGRSALVTVLIVGAVLASLDGITLATYLSFAVVGGLLVDRRPRNSIGWILIVIGFGFIGTTTPPDIDLAGLRAGTASIRDMAYAWVTVWAGGTSFLAYAVLAMVFPSGRLPAGPWRRPTLAGLALGVLVVALPAFASDLVFSVDGRTEVVVRNPLGVFPSPTSGSLPVLQALTTGIPIAILAASVVGLLVRYRRAVGVEALQIRWLLASVALVVISVVFGLVGFVASGMTVGLVWVPALLAYPTVAAAVGIAVLRYRLFDIDRIISRTIAYAVMTGILVSTFAALNLALQTILDPIVQGNVAAVAISTLVVAALFDPLRTRLQRAIDRRFNRTRLGQEAAVARFSRDLRDEVDVRRVLELLRTSTERVVEPTAVGVWQRRRRATP